MNQWRGEVYQYFRKEIGMLPPPYDLWGGYSVDEYREYLVECKKQKRNDVKWKYSIELPPIEEWRRIKNTPSRKWAGHCLRGKALVFPNGPEPIGD